MSKQIWKFCLGVSMVAAVLVLHRFSIDEAMAQARLEGYRTGFRAWQDSQINMASACQSGAQRTSPLVNTVLRGN